MMIVENANPTDTRAHVGESGTRSKISAKKGTLMIMICNAAPNKALPQRYLLLKICLEKILA